MRTCFLCVIVAGLAFASGTAAAPQVWSINVSDDFHHDRSQAIIIYSSEWKPIDISTDLQLVNGKYLVSFHQTPTVIQRQRQERQGRLGEKFSFNDYFAMTEDNPYASQWLIRCWFEEAPAPALAKLFQIIQSVQVEAKLRSARGQELDFDCQWEGQFSPD